MDRVRTQRELLRAARGRGQRKHPRHGAMADRPDGWSADGAARRAAGRAARTDHRHADRTDVLQLAACARQASIVRARLARVRLRWRNADLPCRCGERLPLDDRLLSEIPRRRRGAVELREQYTGRLDAGDVGRATRPAAPGLGPTRSPRASRQTPYAARAAQALV